MSQRTTGVNVESKTATAPIYVGLDIHQSHTTMHVLDAQGNRLQRRTINGYWPLVALETSPSSGARPSGHRASDCSGTPTTVQAQNDKSPVMPPSSTTEWSRLRSLWRRDLSNGTAPGWDMVRLSPMLYAIRKDTI